MVLRKVGVLSCAKLSGALYAAMGLIIGAVLSLFGILGSALGGEFSPEGLGFGLVFGIGAIIFLPLMYGVLGFIVGAIMAFLYNVVAGYIGGIEVEFAESPPSPYGEQPSQPMP